MSAAQPEITPPSIGNTAPHDIPPEVLEVLATAKASSEVASRSLAAAEALLQAWSSGSPRSAGPLATAMSDAAAQSAGPSAEQATAEQATAQVRDLAQHGETLGIDSTDTALGTERASAEPDPGR